jgi:hypothetical protein
VKSRLTISLTGGLGNQLFQLAAGLALRGRKQLVITSVFGNPRLNVNMEPELLSFRIPEDIELTSTSSAPYFLKKVSGYLLRIGVRPRKFEKIYFFSKLIKLLGSFLFTFYFKSPTFVKFSKGIGYHTFHSIKGNSLLFGYFQSYQWVATDEVKKQMMELVPKYNSPAVNEYELLAELEKPLVVHVRLGDYLNEKGFGNLPSSYYNDAITKALGMASFGSLWLFSDDVKEAKKILPSNITLPIRVIGQVQNSTALTFQIMRLGHGFVIANSTFSWWAAYLRFNLDAKIIAPAPWFRDFPEPIALIPNEWLRVDAKFPVF